MAHRDDPSDAEYDANRELFSRTYRDRVRPSIKALIIRDNCLLVTTNSDNTEDFYLLPGGGQNFRESMRDALVRECREEVSVEIAVGDLACVRDYIGANHEFAEWDSHYHQIEMLFWASIAPDAVPAVGVVGDTFQTGVAWVPLSELADAPLYPAALKTWLLLPPDQRPHYLGDVN